jgi:serine/threonine-protein kinase RsbW
LLTSELVTNSIEHSDSRLPGGTVSVTLQVGVDRVRVEVADGGGASVPTLRCDDVQAEAGRGLRLVDACSLAWSYYRSTVGTVTWFECGPEPLP